MEVISDDHWRSIIRYLPTSAILELADTCRELRSRVRRIVRNATAPMTRGDLCAMFPHLETLTIEHKWALPLNFPALATLKMEDIPAEMRLPETLTSLNGNILRASISHLTGLRKLRLRRWDCQDTTLPPNLESFELRSIGPVFIWPKSLTELSIPEYTVAELPDRLLTLHCQIVACQPPPGLIELSARIIKCDQFPPSLKRLTYTAAPQHVVDEMLAKLHTGTLEYFRTGSADYTWNTVQFLWQDEANLGKFVPHDPKKFHVSGWDMVVRGGKPARSRNGFEAAYASKSDHTYLVQYVSSVAGRCEKFCPADWTGVEELFLHEESIDDSMPYGVCGDITHKYTNTAEDVPPRIDSTTFDPTILRNLFVSGHIFVRLADLAAAINLEELRVGRRAIREAPTIVELPRLRYLSACRKPKTLRAPILAKMFVNFGYLRETAGMYFLTNLVIKNVLGPLDEVDVRHLPRGLTYITLGTDRKMPTFGWPKCAHLEIAQPTGRVRSWCE